MSVVPSHAADPRKPEGACPLVGKGRWREASRRRPGIANRALAALLLLLVTLLTPVSSHAIERVVLQLKWKHAFQFAGYYAAVEKGFYEQAGLEVTLREGGPETHFADELSSGRSEYAVALASMLIHRNQGKPIVALAAILQHSPEVLMVLESSGINNPHQMAGRTVAASPEDTPALLAMFKNEGLAKDAVKTIPYEFDLDRMKSGAIHGLGAYTINEPFVCQEKGVGVRLIQPRDYGVDFYGDCLFTNEEEIKKHPKRVRAFIDASLKGWQYAMANRDEMIELLINKYQVPVSVKALEFEAEEMNKLMFSDLIDIGHMNTGRWKHIGDTYVRLGMLKPDYSLDGFVYDRYPESNLAWLWWTSGITAAATLVLGGIALGLIRVNNRIGRAERQASESKAMLQTILNTIPVGVFWKDTQSRFIGCNQVFADHVGLKSPAEIAGLTVDRLPAGWRTAMDPATDKEVLSQGKASFLHELMVSDATGEVLHFSQSKVPMRNEQGSPIGLLGVVEDITPRRQSEERQTRLKDRLLQAQKFESLNRLANGVCHHSNNMLQSIISFADLAKLTSMPGPSRNHIDGVIRESRRVARLNQMLMTCTGQGFHQFDAVALGTLIEDLLPALATELPPHHELRWDHLDGDNRIIRADRESLRQMLVQLVINASESTGSQESLIHLRTSVLTCDQGFLHDASVTPPPPPGDYACIELIDQGSGMSPEVMQMVFDPFFSTKLDGRGLGMATVMGIVKSHQGTIKLDSKPGKGTTVRVLLPVMEAS